MQYGSRCRWQETAPLSEEKKAEIVKEKESFVCFGAIRQNYEMLVKRPQNWRKQTDLPEAKEASLPTRVA